MSTTGDTAFADAYGREKIYHVNVGPDAVEVFKRAEPSWWYPTPILPRRPPDKVWKEVWLVVEGKLVRQPDVIGKHVPEARTPESITFD